MGAPLSQVIRSGAHKHKFFVAGALLAVCVLLLLASESKFLSNRSSLLLRNQNGPSSSVSESSSEGLNKGVTISYLNNVLNWNITRDESDNATLPSFPAGTCFRANVEGSSRRCLPSFIIIGTQKSGTTELSSWLQANPALLRVRPIESHLFDCLPSAKWSDRGLCDKKRYGSMKLYKSLMTYIQMSPMQPTKSPKIVFEKTPAYFDLADPEVVTSALVGLKVVVILRSPTDRFYSSYWHSCRSQNRQQGRDHVHHMCTHKEFDERVSELAEQINEQGGCLNWTPEPKTIFPRLFDIGRYTMHLSRWRKHIPDSHIFFIFRDNFIKDPFAVMAQLEQWLDAPAFDYHTLARKTKTGIWRVGKETFKVHDYKDISVTSKATVDGLYRDCNARLCEEFVSRGYTDLPEWLRTTCPTR